MENSDNNTNENVTDSVALEPCDVSVDSLDKEVSIVDLRDELGLIDAPSEVKTEQASAEEQNTNNDENYMQVDVDVEASEADASIPSQEDLLSLAEQAQELAKIEPVAGDDVEDTDDIISSTAKKVAEIEPEAGTQAAPTSSGNASGGGYGFQSSFDAQGVISLKDVGPIDPTKLQYGIDNRNDELFAFEEELPPVIPVLEFGEYRVYEDGDVRVAVFAAPETEDGDITFTISGIPTGWSVTDAAFDFANAPVGTGVFDSAAGTWTITLTNGAVFDGGPIFSPPADSDVDALNLVFTVSEVNPAGQSGTTRGTSFIIVDAVADDPDIDAQDDMGLEGATLDIDIAALTGEEVNNGAGMDDSSESITGYQISGVPAGFTLSAGTETFAGSGIYNLTPADIVGLQITPNDPTYFGSIGLTATVFTTENAPTDTDFDFTNNNAQDSDRFSLTWKPVANPPSVKVNQGIDDALVKEDSSVDVPIVATLDPAGSGSEILTVTVTGIDSSWGFTAPVGTYDSSAGTWTITLPAGQDLSTVFTFTPPADSDLDMTGLQATASAYEPATNTTANAAPDGFQIITDAVADDPDIDAANDSGLEGVVLDIDIAALTGEEVNNGAGMDDSSESITGYQISGVPAGFTLSAGSETFPGSGVYNLTPAEIVGLQITPPNSNYFGTLNLTATVFTTENPVSDGEFDLTDNNAQDSDGFSLTWKPLANPPCVKVNQGIDDALVKEDSSVDVPIVATLDPAGSGSEILTVTVTGIDSSWGFTAPVGTYDSSAGTWTITLPAGQDLSTVFTFTPPADSDLDMTGLQATASAYEPATNTTANAAPDGFQIITDAVADDPDIDAANDSGLEGVVLDIDIAALTGEEVNNGAGMDDSSESITGYQISGVPAGFTLSAGSETFPGSGVYNLTPAEIVGLQITPPNSNYFGTLNLTATVFTTENPVSDGEFDLTDNNAQDSDGFSLTWNPVINPPCIKVNNGIDDALVKEDHSIDVPITAQLGANPAVGEYLTVTVTGIDPSWGTFTSTIGTYDSGTGTWIITLGAGESLDTVFNFAPNGDSDIDLTGLVATVVATDPLANLTASANDDFNVIVDAVADTPDLDTSKASGEEGTVIALNITTSVNDTDGSEVIEVIKIGNLPAGTSLTAGTYNAVDDVWELSPADLVGLGLNVPDGVTGNFELTVESVAYEQNTNGIEVDLTDNRASAFDVIKVCVEEDHVPVITGDEVTVDETNLSPTTFVSSNVSADFGNDAPGTIEGNGTFLIGNITSGGTPVTVTFDAPTNTYTGMAGAETIFTLVIQSNGDYTFTLEGVLDHPDVTDHNDSLPLEFGVKATDSDGDASDAVITVNVLDDGPVIHNKFAWVDETDLANGTIGYTKTLDFDFGEDGAGSIDPTGNFTAAFQVGGSNQQLTAGGVAIDVTTTANGYVGMAGGETIFTLTLNSQSGEYTYTQFETIDHPDATNHDDVIWLKFEVQVTDADGDTATAIIGVDVHDDGPVIHDKFSAVDETDLANGTIGYTKTLDFDFGEDGAGSIDPTGNFTAAFQVGGSNQQLTAGGVAIDVTTTANGYVGMAGGETIFTLTLNSQSGEYTYTQFETIDHPDATNHDDVIWLKFEVQVTDADGDTATAIIGVDVHDDGPVIYDKFSAVDETNLENGPIGYTKTLNFEFGEDGAGSIDATGNFVAKFQVGGPDVQLTAGGVAIGVTTTANGYVGMAGGETIFTLTLNSQSGEYTYTQFETIDHPDATNHDDVIWLKFEVQVTDADGDTATAIIGVDVHDDGPVAHDDCIEFNASEGSYSANVVDNDVLSQDADNTVTQIKFDGSVFDVPTDGSDIVINGEFGALTINNTGAYTYDPFDTAFSSGGSDALNPEESDVAGTQSSITKNGITVEIANVGNYDISWKNTSDGNGLGIDNLNTGDSKKVWPTGETFDVSFDQNVQSVTLTIAELGNNNNSGNYGLDYVVTLADGTEVIGEQQFVPSEIVGGHFTFTLDASDFGGQTIASIEISSVDGAYDQYIGASFLLNNVVVEYPHVECVQDNFEYVLTDGDGDTSVAELKIKTFAPDDVLIVGQNVNDDDNSIEPHLVNGDEGVIEGGFGNDILVGDAGGSSIEEQTQDYNFVFILDVSGSMGDASEADSKISLLKDAVENLLNEFGSYTDGQVRIHITPFASGVNSSASFTVTDMAGLVNALAYLETLDGSGYTNYELPMQDAIAWLESGDALGGNAITTTYFISDGQPNRYVDGTNSSASGNASVVMGEITGTDGTNEVAMLHTLSDEVIAVGINIGANISNLHIIDSDGSALNITDPADLMVALADTSPLDKLDAAGDDVLEGGEGNDIIFGDVLFTDDLSVLHGLSIDKASGWEVFEGLENGESAIDAGWSRDDTIAYIQSNAQDLSQESVNSEGEGRNGGDDVIHGGGGNDLIFGQEGNDIIAGGLGDDVIYGGSGADIFLFEAINEGIDTVKDFDFSEGDLVDLSALLSGYDALTDDIADFVIATEVGGNTTLSVDQAGNAGVGGSIELVILEGVTGFDLDASIKTDAVIV